MNQIQKLVSPLTLGLILAAGVFASDGKYLTIGDPAPALKPAKWLKGTPVKGFEKGKLYVVEFWATWCHPCIENIPHLTELAKKYEGKVTIVGCDIWEQQTSTPKKVMQKVADFVKAQGPKMVYNVAADGANNKIADDWMKAASEGGIPCSFIINGDGKVAWIGHPAKMEPALQKVMGGNYDIVEARKARETELTILRPVDEAIAARDYPLMVKRIDAAIAYKNDLRVRFMYNLLVALFHTDVDRAIATADGVLKETDNSIGVYNMITAVTAAEEGLSPRAYQYGLGKADEIIKSGQQLGLFKAIRGAICFNMGDKEDAIKSVEEAIVETDKQPQVSASFKAMLTKSLAKYKAAK